MLIALVIPPLVFRPDGRITAANGDKATFGGNAKADGLKGNENYQDHGPVADMHVKSTTILAVICSRDGTSASIFGTATVDGAGSFDFRIDVRDLGEPGTSDRYRLRLSNGYDSGNQLLRSGKAREAIEIFKLNVEAYPQGFNTYDSLAEAYMAINDRALALQNYKKSLELNPNNTNATEIVKRLEKAPVVVDAKVFDTYVGEYEVGPGFVLRVFREGNKFLTQATGQGAFEIFPESDTTFYPTAFAAKLTFLKDADGKVTGLRIDQNGRVTVGKKK